ncbi:MAG: Fe-S cluster assembly protein SufD, partial [Actinomycetota bacterium]|nr:Fe-S cluster assembly protein SufD [Actinomycetota bacterium]
MTQTQQVRPSEADVPVVARAIETVASHLHPTPSYDLADYDVPTGREEVWRFTPIKRLRGLLEDTPSEDHLEWKLDAPAAVEVSELTAEAARALGGPAPVDRSSALAVKH